MKHRLYTDEHFPIQVAYFLSLHGHDVLTVRAAGKNNQEINDAEVLDYAISLLRAVVTYDRTDYRRLHFKRAAQHEGIIVCTHDQDWRRLAHNIDQVIASEPTLREKYLRVSRTN